MTTARASARQRTGETARKPQLVPHGCVRRGRGSALPPSVNAAVLWLRRAPVCSLFSAGCKLEVFAEVFGGRSVTLRKNIWLHAYDGRHYNAR